MKTSHLAVINAGSSSIKFAVFVNNDRLHKVISGVIDNIGSNPVFKVKDQHNASLKNESFSNNHNYEFFYDLLFSYLKNENYNIKAVGHRVVHGGRHYQEPVLLTPAIINNLKTLSSFAPLHQPYNLLAIEILQKLYPTLNQVACFDTAFHRTHPPIADQFGLPKNLTQAGIQRYGFHGLSYEYMMYTLKEIAHPKLNQNIVVAHLGNGASLCAIQNEKSIDSTMGFTALDGLLMGTRCGSLDPGVILYLLEHEQLSHQAIAKLLYHQSGLLGVSQISNNMQILLQESSVDAHNAVDLFIYRIKRELGALIAVLGGLDLLIFTGGIGENAVEIRERVCENLAWLGVKINSKANSANNFTISHPQSQLEVLVIPTNEEWIIAQHTAQLVQ